MFLVHDMLRAIDPIRFARECGYEPDPFQVELLTTTARNVAMLCSRQVGKTTGTATLALHKAIYRAPATVLIVSTSQPQSEIVIGVIKEQHARLSHVPEPISDAVFRFDLNNGSKIRALSGNPKSARGWPSADLVLADEAARIDDEMIAAIRPTLVVKGGQFVALTTPAGKRGWFYEGWHAANNWKRIEVTAAQCDRISAETLADELENLGPVLYSQEYCNAWLDDATAVFDAAGVDEIFNKKFEPLWPSSVAA